jgi:lysozyme family protein
MAMAALEDYFSPKISHENLRSHSIPRIDMKEDNFEYALGFLLPHEGLYSNAKNDSGGPSKFGVSLRFIDEEGINIDVNHDGPANKTDVLLMSKSEAADIYRQYWWDKYKYYLINDKNIAAKVFDMSVNMGGHQAHKLLQEAMNNISHGPKLEVNGDLDNKTLNQVNRYINYGHEHEVLDSLKDVEANFYIELVQKHPRLKTFLTGWLRRANEQP